MSSRLRLPVALMFAALALIASARSAAAQASGPQPGVLYWPAADSFKGPSLLVERMASNNYNVYAVRRDVPGRPELHERDMDIVFVLEGAATFFTGGSVKDERVSGPGEKTGTAIEGGSPHVLGKGDVIMVPNGVAHWFGEVSPSIRYFAVKVRQDTTTPASPSAVRYWKAADAFATRGVLLDAAGRFARVYALSRSMPLNVEQHQLDTDLVFVIGGAGTFITNGTIVEPRTLATNEGTGSAITDGTPRPLAAGAVLVVPAGTPHWLRDIDGTIDFFAVKVR